jgi:phenylacetate-CoA ligase
MSSGKPSHGSGLMDSVYSLLIPLKDPNYAGLHANLKKGRELEGLPLAHNLEKQWRKTQQMLAHAYETVPFYRRRFDENGVTPQSIQSPADLKRIPILKRDDIRNNLEDLWSRKYSRADLLSAATGGTTDSPVTLLRDRECIAVRNAIRLEFNQWAGVGLSDKVFWLWGAPGDFAKDPSWRWRLYDRYFMRRIWAPTMQLNDEATMAGYAATINKFRPKAIIAYPTPLTGLCQYLLSSNYRGYLPKTAICTAEALLPEQREIIESALHCKVFEVYGARDFGMVAGECEAHDGLHLNPHAIFMEGEELDPASGLQEIIATDLLNPAFPMLRYRINDCVYPQDPQCSCGRGFPRISRIQGRASDNVLCPNGRILAGVSVAHWVNRMVKTGSGLSKMQLIQEARDAFTIKYAPAPDFAPDSLEQLTKMLHVLVEAPVAVDYVRVEDIPREASGKTRLCISRVSGQRLAVG